jgi:hypothetical protein
MISTNDGHLETDLAAVISSTVASKFDISRGSCNAKTDARNCYTKKLLIFISLKSTRKRFPDKVWMLTQPHS